MLILLGIVTIRDSTASITREVTSSSYKVMEQAALGFSFNVEEAKRPLVMLAGNHSVHALLISGSQMGIEEQIQHERNIAELANGITTLQSLISDILILGENGYFNNLDGRKSLRWDYPFAEQPWFRAVLSAPAGKGFVTLGLHKQNYYLPSNLSRYDKFTLSIAIPVRSYNRGTVGAVIANLDLQKINKLFELSSYRKNESILMVDDNRTILVHRDSAKIGTKLAFPGIENIYRQDSGSFVARHHPAGNFRNAVRARFRHVDRVLSDRAVHRLVPGFLDAEKGGASAMSGRKRMWVLDVLMLPFGAVTFIPFYLIVVNTFKSLQETAANPMGFPKKWVFDNYIRVFAETPLLTSFGNSLIITVCSVLLMVLIGAMAAYPVVFNSNRLNRWLTLYLLAGFMIPFQTTLIPLFQLMTDLHLIDKKYGDGRRRICLFPDARIHANDSRRAERSGHHRRLQRMGNFLANHISFAQSDHDHQRHLPDHVDLERFPGTDVVPELAQQRHPGVANL